ncbi:RNA-binding protein FUS-like isoform X1 [Pieris brassicae]|uniref:RNA-binding protein FUS-like isoform X1 n=1 Tax=Pieris brassicae TaxID=7116 RepID=UPI001E65E6A9|nr:RNA-binding protein FUS-like isoform X1 [Pieris brassicae]
MSLKTTLVLLCASILISSVVGKRKIESAKQPTDQGNDEVENTARERKPRQYLSNYYGAYGTQNGYASQGTNQNVDGYKQGVQNGYDGYGQQNRNPGYISGQVRPGETVSIGNGHGHTNVVAINSAGDTDYYVGYTDGGVNTNTGYDQGYPTKKGQSGIIVNKRPDGQDDVLLWNANGNKQSSIGVNKDGAQLYSGNTYDTSYQTYNQQSNTPNYQQGYGKPAGRNAYQSSSSSIYSQQDQVYLNSQRYK